MNTDRFIAHMILVVAVALLVWLPVPSIQAADQAREVANPTVLPGEAGINPAPVVPLASAVGLGIVASGAAEDNLRACLARIPKDASSGQRMIAEQGCERDQVNRQSIQAVPGR